MKARKRLRLITRKMDKARRIGNTETLDKLYTKELVPFMDRMRARAEASDK